jgi:hypothetical protein
MAPIVETEIEYAGIAKAQNQTLGITFAGTANIIFSEDGFRSIEMNVTNESYSGTSTVLLEADYGEFDTLSVECENGIFEVNKAHASLTDQSFGPNPEMKVSFWANEGIFHSALGKGLKPKYWRIPLVNCISRFIQNKPAYDSHPLATKGQWKTFFNFRETEVFIEAILNYEERSKQIIKDKKPRTTAYMVGDVPAEIDLNNYRQWLPLDAIFLLGLATGNRVSFAWIEILDENGTLIRRIHPTYTIRNYSGQPAVINEVFHRGTSELLTKSLTLSAPDIKEVRLNITQLFASVEAHYIEEHFSCLTQALDNLTSEKKLIEDLSDDINAKLTEIVKTLSSKIGDLSNSLSNKTEKETLDLLKNKALHLLDSQEGFSKKLIRLLSDNHLLDYEVLKNVKLKHQEKKWEKIINYFRNIVVHEGVFSAEDHDYDVRLVLNLIKHLEDILIRLIFRKIGYLGKYQPRNAITNTIDSTVDWVTNTTTTQDLGYGPWIS